MDDSEDSKSIVAFPGVELCPLCGDAHEITLLYKGTPILICPKAEANKIYFFEGGESKWQKVRKKAVKKAARAAS